MPRSRKARVADIHEIALGMPHARIYDPAADRPVYQVGGRSFVFFRSPRPDAVDPATGERYDDVVVIWTETLADKAALVQGDGPWFTTPHFEGHCSALLRTSRVGELTLAELTEVIQDAWLARASAARRRAWLADWGLPPT